MLCNLFSILKLKLFISLIEYTVFFDICTRTFVFFNFTSHYLEFAFLSFDYGPILLRTMLHLYRTPQLLDSQSVTWATATLLTTDMKVIVIVTLSSLGAKFSPWRKLSKRHHRTALKPHQPHSLKTSKPRKTSYKLCAICAVRKRSPRRKASGCRLKMRVCSRRWKPYNERSLACARNCETSARETRWETDRDWSPNIIAFSDQFIAPKLNKKGGKICDLRNLN